MSTAPNSRASLLAGLRTGGVRAQSALIPHTAAPGASFSVPRFPSQPHPHPEEDEDQVVELAPHNMFANAHHGGNRTMPMTAAVDGPNNRFIQQQQRGMNPNSVPFSPAFMGATPQVQAQALQLQMMQMELMKIQAQQYQAEVLAQAQRQQPTQPQAARPSITFNPPATAGPTSTGFDLRSATLSAQMRRANHVDSAKSQLVVGGEDHLPMTAALGGKFGARTPSGAALNGPMRFNVDDDALLPPTPNSTTVISGGTSLGSPASNNLTFNNNAPSKSDSVSSWRRGGKSNLALGSNRPTVPSPSVKITPPPFERTSPPPSEASPASGAPTPTAIGSKFRPQPLRFSPAVSQPLPVVAVDSSDLVDVDDTSSNGSSKSNSNSSPTTPRSSSSLEMPLSPREEASKRLYEGLGIGRPTSAISSNGTDAVHVQQVSYSVPMVSRIVSQPLRQPRGPPSGMEELGPKNFATRIRRKAIGGLGMLIGARERRELVEAY